MPALLRDGKDKMSLTPTISISTLYEPKIQLPSITFGAQHCLLNCRLEGFLLAALLSSCRGKLFASTNPLFLLSFSLSLCLSVFFFLFLFSLLFLLCLSVPALLNISSSVSATFAKISWTARDSQQDSQLYVAYMNNRKLHFLLFPCFV